MHPSDIADPDTNLFTRAEYRNAGGNERDLTDLSRLGVITRLGRGVYLAASARIGVPDPRAITRSMRVGLGYASAAAWWGVDLPFTLALLHVIAARNRGRAAFCVPGVRIHRSNVPESDTAYHLGVRLTTPLRTCLDIARSMPIAEGVTIIDGFLRAKLLDLSSLQRRVAELPAGPGRRAAQAAVAWVDPKSGSVFESLTRMLLVLNGITPPTSQHVVRTARGRWIGQVDFAWPDLKVILECDSFEYHASVLRRIRDQRRYSSFTRAGWRVISVSWHDVVNDPEYVLELVRDVLALEDGAPVSG